jgi:hypothetical protein
MATLRSVDPLMKYFSEQGDERLMHFSPKGLETTV